MNYDSIRFNDAPIDIGIRQDCHGQSDHGTIHERGGIGIDDELQGLHVKGRSSSSDGLGRLGRGSTSTTFLLGWGDTRFMGSLGGIFGLLLGFLFGRIVSVLI